MASHRICHRLFYIANSMPSVSLRQAAASALKRADHATAVGEASASPLRNGGGHSCQKPRTMASAAEELAPNQTGREVFHDTDRGRHGALFHGRRRHSPFDLFDTFFPNRNLRFMIDRMDCLFDGPFFHRSWTVSGGRPAQDHLSRTRTPWDFAETSDAFHMRLDLPGLGKEEVKVYVEDGSLVVETKHSEPENNADEPQWTSRSHGSHYSTRILLPDNANAKSIKAELKNGVLSVSIPKVAEEEPKKEVIDVQIE